MAETLSKIAAFVFENGSMAQQILFRDLDDEGELPGLSPEEREAMSAVVPELRDTWVSLLTACRAALWRRAAGHATEAILQTPKTLAGTMWKKGGVTMPLLANNQASCGLVIEVCAPSTQYQLDAWVWTQPMHRAAADGAVSALTQAPWRSEYGSYVLTLPPLKEGDNIEALAEAAAAALWSMARPIADAITAEQRK